MIDEWDKLDGMRNYTQERLEELAWVIGNQGLLYNRIELDPAANPFPEDRGIDNPFIQTIAF